MYKNILVCLDGSKQGEVILPYVEAQAEKFKSKITLLRIVNVSSHDFAGVTSRTPADEHQMIEKQIERIEDEASDYLCQLSGTLCGKGLDVECVVLRDDAIGEGIVRYARKSEVDLIALATHGHSRLRRMFSGSLTGFLLSKTKLPVLIVKRGKS